MKFGSPSYSATRQRGRKAHQSRPTPISHCLSSVSTTPLVIFVLSQKHASEQAMPSSRWLDHDEDRLPEGMTRVGYDADEQRYTFKDAQGLWLGEEGHEYGGQLTYIGPGMYRAFLLLACWLSKSWPRAGVCKGPSLTLSGKQQHRQERQMAHHLLAANELRTGLWPRSSSSSACKPFGSSIVICSSALNAVCSPRRRVGGPAVFFCCSGSIYRRIHQLGLQVVVQRRWLSGCTGTTPAGPSPTAPVWRSTSCFDTTAI